MGIKFYRTFGQARRPRVSDAPEVPGTAGSQDQERARAESAAVRSGLPRWLALALVPIVALSIVSVIVLFLNVYRGDYKNTRMIAFERSLNFWLQGDEFRVGQRSAISLTLSNPLAQPVTVNRAEIHLPARFLEAFTVDAPRCRTQPKADGSGIVTCENLNVPANKNYAFTVPVVASKAGNYDGELSLALELAVPAADHPWYVSVDSAGNYALVLQRARTLDLRITP